MNSVPGGPSYKHTHTRTHTHNPTHAHTYVSTYAYTNTHTHTQKHTDTHAFINAHTPTHTQTRTHIDKQTHTHKLMHTHSHYLSPTISVCMSILASADTKMSSLGDISDITVQNNNAELQFAAHLTLNSALVREQKIKHLTRSHEITIRGQEEGVSGGEPLGQKPLFHSFCHHQLTPYSRLFSFPRIT